LKINTVRRKSRLRRLQNSYCPAIRKRAIQQAEEAAVSAKYDKEIKAAGKNSKKVEKLEKEKEEKPAKVRAEYGDKSFAIQVAQAIANTAMAAINACSSAAAIPAVGAGFLQYIRILNEKKR
jgi:hypothetical protein